MTDLASPATGSSQQTVSVYVCHLNAARIIQTSILKPIRCGSALSDAPIDILRDDVGDNISAKNKAYCELSAIYWAWKNDNSSSHIGFCHYRRFFDFRPDEDRTVDPYYVIRSKTIDAEKFGLDDATIDAMVAKHQAIVAAPADIRTLSFKDLRHQYRATEDHFLQDLDKAGEIIAEISPEYSDSFNETLNGYLLHPNLMFILPRETFNRFCEFVFPVLDRLEREIPVVGRSPSGRRAIGYVGERLFNVFLTHEKKRGLNPFYLRRVLVENTAPAPTSPAIPETSLPIVSIVASTDENFAPHMGALIASVLSNASPTRFIDFIVLDGGLAKNSRAELSSLTRLHPHCSISFVEMTGAFLDAKEHPHFSRVSLYRVGLGSLLSNHSRVVFLDTDTIVRSDIAELFDTPLDGKILAAVRDIGMRAIIGRKAKVLKEAGGELAVDYLKNNVGLDQPETYFQAGVMVIDLDALRSMDVERRMISDLMDEVFWFIDQDVLNKYLSGKVKYLPNEWNAVSFDLPHQHALNDSELDDYNRSNLAPKIFHFAGPEKPWVNPFHPWAREYWRYLKMTGWYEQMLVSTIIHSRPAPSAGFRPLRIFRPIARLVWRSLPIAIKTRIQPTAHSLAKMMGAAR